MYNFTEKCNEKLSKTHTELIWINKVRDTQSYLYV